MKYRKQTMLRAFNAQYEKDIDQAERLRERENRQFSEAYQEFRRLSEAGYPLGQYYQAYACMDDRAFWGGTERPDDLALVGPGGTAGRCAQSLFDAIRIEAEQGNAIAQYALGMMYLMGRGVDRNEEEAEKLFRMSAEQGYARAQYELGQVLQIGPKTEEAITWFFRSAEQDNNKALLSLIGLYDTKHMAKHELKIKVLFLCREAMITGGGALERAWNQGSLLPVPRNEGDPELLCLYGELFLSKTLLGEPNYTEAHRCLNAAAQQGHRRARCYLGLLYDYNLVDSNSSSVAAWFLHVHHTRLDTSFGLQQVVTGLHLMRGVVNKISPWIESSAHESFKSAIQPSAEYKNYSYRPLIHFLESQKSYKARALLGIIYAGGLLGIERNLAKAEENFEAVRSEKDKWLQYSIGYFYEQGWLLDKNPQKARGWYELAQAKGLSRAQERLEALDKKPGVNNPISTKAPARRPEDKPATQTKPRSTVVMSFSENHQKTKRVKTKDQYDATDAAELSFAANEVLEIIQVGNENNWGYKWHHCKNSNRQEGLVYYRHLGKIMEEKDDLIYPAQIPLPKELVVIGETELVREEKPIAKGGFGAIYKAQWMGMTVVVKEPLSGADVTPQVVADFQNELALMSALRHPNIVTLHGYVNVNNSGSSKLVMEYMGNGTLYSHFGGNPNRANSKTHLDYSIRYSIALNVAEGLHFMHKNQVLHRDLKSLNILLTTHQENKYFAKLVDFGLSEKGSEATRKGERAEGTLYMLAPELMPNNSTVQRIFYNTGSDIYAFALILYELACYRRPYATMSENMIYERVKAGYREDLPDDDKDISKKFKEAISQGWAQSSEARPSMDILIQWLREGMRKQKEIEASKSKQGSVEDISREEPSDDEKSSERQSGWNCFDIAINKELTKHLDLELRYFDRDKFIEEYVPLHMDLCCRLLAPEIRHAAALTAVQMNVSSNEGAEANKDKAKKITRLFKLAERLVAEGCDAEQVEGLVNDEIERLLCTKDHELFVFALPEVMHTPKLVELFEKYMAGDEQGFKDHCSSEATCWQYIEEYYAKEGWFAFQRSVAGEENNSSMIEVVANYLKVDIKIYSASGVLLHTARAENLDGQEVAVLEITFINNNHFVAGRPHVLEVGQVVRGSLSGNPHGLFFAPRAESESSEKAEIADEGKVRALRK